LPKGLKNIKKSLKINRCILEILIQFAGIHYFTINLPALQRVLAAADTKTQKFTIE
jgi:hypothetical protein